MRRYFISLFVAVVLSTSCALDQARTVDHVSTDFTFPPEWQAHEAVWMGWSDDDGQRAVQMQMMKAMLPHVAIRLMVTSPEERHEVLQALATESLNTERVECFVHKIRNVWIRDAGPRFLSSGGKLAVANFAWSAYGYPNEVSARLDPDTLRRGIIADDMAETLALPLRSSTMVAEGGGIESSSDTLLAYQDTALQRNPGKSIEQIEAEYRRVLGKKHVVWLSRCPFADRVFSGPKLANYFGFGANGHIDEYVRFLDDKTIAIAQIDADDAAGDRLSMADREILLENLEELRVAKRADGTAFQIVTLPSPGLQHHMWTGPLAAVHKQQDRFAAWYRDFAAGDEVHWIPALSYLNFFVTNGVVLVPKYWREGLPEREQQKDEEVRAKLASHFPGREIVQIDALPLNWGGGGMHCVTQQQPAIAAMRTMPQ